MEIPPRALASYARNIKRHAVGGSVTDYPLNWLLVIIHVSD